MTVTQPAAPRAPGISYFEAAPGFEVFRCTTYRTSLAPGACSKRHLKAQSATPEQLVSLDRCRDCKIGMTHAGVEVVDRSEFYRSNRCSRCQRGGTRLIRGQWCPSCYNRMGEFKRGANAKGRPITFRFDPRRVGVVLNYDTAPRYVEVEEPLTANWSELLFGIMRVTPGRTAFCVPLGRPAMSIAELAIMIGEPRLNTRGVTRPKEWRPNLGIKRRPLPHVLAGQDVRLGPNRLTKIGSF